MNRPNGRISISGTRGRSGGRRIIDTDRQARQPARRHHFGCYVSPDVTFPPDVSFPNVEPKLSWRRISATLRERPSPRGDMHGQADD
jgi:hypothetical protein